MKMRRLWLVYFLRFILVTGVIGYGSLYLFADKSVDVMGSSSQFLRFHVLANSDSEVDQQTKLKVRDAVVNYLTPKMEHVKTVADAQKIVEIEKYQLVRISQSILNAEQAEYGASVQVGEYEFPIKAYGDLILPAGKYQAVKIVLGKGEGKNWWCVLFPPLCFINVTHVTGAAGNDASIDFSSSTEVKYTWKLMEIIKDNAKQSD